MVKFSLGELSNNSNKNNFNSAGLFHQLSQASVRVRNCNTRRAHMKNSTSNFSISKQVCHFKFPASLYNSLPIENSEAGFTNMKLY